MKNLLLPPSLAAIFLSQISAATTTARPAAPSAVPRLLVRVLHARRHPSCKAASPPPTHHLQHLSRHLTQCTTVLSWLCRVTAFLSFSFFSLFSLITPQPLLPSAVTPAMNGGLHSRLDALFLLTLSSSHPSLSTFHFADSMLLYNGFKS